MNVQLKTHTMKNNLNVLALKLNFKMILRKKENKMILREMFYKNPREYTYVSQFNKYIDICLLLWK